MEDALVTTGVSHFKLDTKWIGPVLAIWKFNGMCRVNNSRCDGSILRMFLVWLHSIKNLRAGIRIDLVGDLALKIGTGETVGETKSLKVFNP